MRMLLAFAAVQIASWTRVKWMNAGLFIYSFIRITITWLIDSPTGAFQSNFIAGLFVVPKQLCLGCNKLSP